MANASFSDFDILAFLVSIREKISQNEVPPIVEFQTEFNLIGYIKHFCEMIVNKQRVADDFHNKQVSRYMALEVSWTMANISFGPVEVIEQLLFDFAIDQNQSLNSERVSSPSYALRLIEGVLDGDDLAHQEIVMHLVGNCMFESVNVGLYLLKNDRLMLFINRISHTQK